MTATMSKKKLLSKQISKNYDDDTDDEPMLFDVTNENDSDIDSDIDSDSEDIVNNILSTTATNSMIIPQNIAISKKSNAIFKELIRNQLPSVPIQWKLNTADMKRICKYIESTIFNPDQCCVWKGYVTNVNNSEKGTYVNFYFRNKKVALHRLLYSNFVAPLNSSEYLKFNCINKGICCSIHHYEKYKYIKTTQIVTPVKKDGKQKNKKKNSSKDIIIFGGDNPEDLIIDFD